MREAEISVRTDDGEMTTFVAHPDAPGPFPVAVLYMDGIGYREQVRANARRFAADGYVCVAPDLFYRSGEGITFDMDELAAEGSDGPIRQRMMSIVGGLEPAMVEADTKALLHVMEGEPAAEVGRQKVCVGYCMGARFALHAAAALPDEFAAAAGIHPSALATDRPDSPDRELPNVRGELYFAFAENDPGAAPDTVDRFRAELVSEGIAGTVEVLPGTAHGFAMADLPVYDQSAAERHFARTLELWRRSLSKEPASAS